MVLGFGFYVCCRVGLCCISWEILDGEGRMAWLLQNGGCSIEMCRVMVVTQ